MSSFFNCPTMYRESVAGVELAGLLLFILSGLCSPDAQQLLRENRCHIPHFVNGRAKLISRGHVLTFKCYRGFTMLESLRRAICLRGEWHPSRIPVCVKEGCMDLPPPLNGYKQVAVGGALIKFECDTGTSVK